MSIIKDTWICKECGAWNAAYRIECGKCLEMKEYKVRQYRSRQGKRDNQYESTAKILGFTTLILFATVVISLIWQLIILLGNVFS